MEFSGIFLSWGEVGSNFLCRQQVAESEVFFVFRRFFSKLQSCWNLQVVLAVGSVHPHGNCFLGKFLWQKPPVSTAQCFLEPPRHQLQQKPDVLLAMDRSDLPKSRFSKKVRFLEMERCWG